MNSQYKIGDISRLFNLSSEMIRYYEKMGIIDRSATSGATRPHERPATATKQNVEKQQEIKRPATASTIKNNEVKANVVKERPLSSGGSSAKTVNQEIVRQNYKADRVTKTTVQKHTQQSTEKNKRTLFKKGQKKK